MNAKPPKRVFTPEQRLRLGRVYMVILNWKRDEEQQEKLQAGLSLDITSTSDTSDLKSDFSQQKGDICSV